VIVCPRDGSDDADMHSILTVLAIESLAPHVRTVVEVNNPKHVDHFRRADVDEVLVTSKLASRLLARTALNPGLSDLVTDMVSGGLGSELYRVQIPEALVGHKVSEAAPALLIEFGATLVGVVDPEGKVVANAPAALELSAGHGLIILAESLNGFATQGASA
jgi:voltage-gated potassium channel